MTYSGRLFAAIAFAVGIIATQVAIAIASKDLGRLMGIPIVIVVAFGLVLFFFWGRSAGANRRKRQLFARGLAWIADARIANSDLEEIGGVLHVETEPHTYAVTADESGLTFWRTTDDPVAHIDRDHISTIQDSGLEDPQHGAGTIVVATDRASVALDLVGPLFGAYPASPGMTAARAAALRRMVGLDDQLAP